MDGEHGGREAVIAERRRRARARRRRNRRLRIGLLAAAILGVGVIVVMATGVMGGGGGDGDPPAAQADAAAGATTVPSGGDSSGPTLVEATAAQAGTGATVDVTMEGGAGSMARLMMLDDRDQGVPVSGWRQAGEIPVPARVLETGPARILVQVRHPDGSVHKGPVVLASSAPQPTEARVIRHVSGSGQRVALVFDDGLDPEAMTSILATLRKENASGTFCLNGYLAETWGEAVLEDMRKALLEGTLELCSHGYSHRTSTSTTLEQAREDLQRNVDVLDAKLGATTRPLYRPPYGSLSDGILAAAGELGYRDVVLWDVDPGDYQKPSPQVLTNSVVNASRAGSITVMHTLPGTAKALPEIIRGLRLKGLEPVGVGRMLRAAERRRNARVGVPATASPQSAEPPAGETTTAQ